MRSLKMLVVSGLVAGLMAFCMTVSAQTEVAVGDLDDLIDMALADSPGGVTSTQALGTMGEGAEYTLGKNDVVNILVRNQQEFSGQFVIGPDGNIQYNFVGDIKAEGLTKTELEEVLTKKLEKFVKIPEVTVVIAGYNSKFIYLLGELKKPGKYPMKGDQVELRAAIAAAGLPTRGAALRRSIVINPDPSKPTYQKVDLYNILYKGLLKDNLTLAPGDVVVVPATVPTELNRALTNLLSPVVKAGSVYKLYDTER